MFWFCYQSYLCFTKKYWTRAQNWREWASSFQASSLPVGCLFFRSSLFWSSRFLLTLSVSSCLFKYLFRLAVSSSIASFGWQSLSVSSSIVCRLFQYCLVFVACIILSEYRTCFLCIVFSEYHTLLRKYGDQFSTTHSVVSQNRSIQLAGKDGLFVAVLAADIAPPVLDLLNW